VAVGLRETPSTIPNIPYTRKYRPPWAATISAIFNAGELSMSDTDSRNIAPISPPVRGRPFAKGNPGKPKGARAHANRYLDHIKGSDLKEIVSVLVEKSKLGHTPSIEILLSRLAPVPVDRRVSFDWPADLNTAGVGRAFDSVLLAIGESRLSISEGLALGALLEKRAKVLDTGEIQTEIAELRAMIEKLQASR